MSVSQGGPLEPANWSSAGSSTRLWQAATAVVALACALLLLGMHTHPLALCQLHSCEVPRQCGFNTKLRIEDVQWSTTAGGYFDRLSIAGCEMRRYSAAEARQCLAGKRLVFIGDSVTRYQYLVLAYWLEQGRWPPPRGGVQGEPSIANHHEWSNLTDFWVGSNALLGGHELCDCGVSGTAASISRASFDNRHYRSGNVSVTYLRYSDEHVLMGHNGFPPYDDQGVRPCAPSTCGKRLGDWRHTLDEGLAHGVVKELRPSHLFINSGLHGSSNRLNQSELNRIAFFGRQAVHWQQGRVFWKTTTATGLPYPTTRDHDAAALDAILRLGWGVYDTYALTLPLLKLTKKAQWDTVHFHAGVYRELNQYMLNMICRD